MQNLKSVKFSKNIALFLLASCFSIVLWADPAPTTNTATAAPSPLQRQCPPPTALIKDPKTLLWSAPPDFKSYQTSFATKIKNFLGAQWQGVAIGQINCLYEPDSMTFPIVLYYNKLVKEPTNGQWSKNLKGYRNCKSADMTDCTFILHPKKKQTTNIYTQLSDYKKTAPVSSQPGF